MSQMLAAMHDIQPGLPRVHVEKTRKNNKPETDDDPGSVLIKVRVRNLKT